MKKHLQITLLAALGIAIGYQTHSLLKTEKPQKPTIPDIPVTMLDGTLTTISRIGSNRHTVVFLMRSNCAFCKKETQQVRAHMDQFKDTEVVFVSFEDAEVIKKYKSEMFPEERPYINFVKAPQKELEQFLEHKLVFPYMLWYDKNGLQKAQHQGVFPVSRIIEVIQKTS